MRARPASGCSYTRSHANTAASVLIIYRTAIAPEWIDYNGHLRDAYYGLIVSYAADALMDKIGMDAAYRDRTHRTLYTVEMHLHFLREVKHSDITRTASGKPARTHMTAQLEKGLQV